MATKNFKHLQAALAEKPDYDKRAVAAEHAVLEEIRTYDRTLAEIRKARKLTQQDLAKASGVTQPEISRIEHQADLYLSTLRGYLHGLGAELSIVAHFGDGEVVRVSLDEISEAAFRDSDDAAGDVDNFTVCR